jgi:HAD superfamily hydrolase (TIGR01509 family)
MARTILFDFNGVIVDDEPEHCRALIQTLAEEGIMLSADDYASRYLGLDDRACFRQAFRLAGENEPSAAKITALVNLKHARFSSAIAAGVPLVPGVLDFVEKAAQEGVRLGLVSGALRREIEPVLQRIGLEGHFQCLVAAEDVDRCKPDPAGYLAALSYLASQPEEAMILEDSLPGLAAARAARVRCTMLSTSYAPARLADADAVWENFLGRTPADLAWLDG